MGASYMTNPIVFLIDTVVSLYILAIILRFLFQWTRADFYNPISQFLVKITHPPLKFLRRFVPSIGKIDTSSIVLAMSLQMLADFSILAIQGGTAGVAALILYSFKQIVEIILNILVFAVFARAILSWFDPGNYNAASSLLQSLTEPLLGLCRKVIPDLGGIDLSPLVALVFLQLAKMMILPPLSQLALLLG
ncbi:MAG: YggT family protein [Methylococcaceae bacterium]|nr:YggT family protein [Methylococcaceae bacterium]